VIGALVNNLRIAFMPLDVTLRRLGFLVSERVGSKEDRFTSLISRADMCGSHDTSFGREITF